MRSALIAALASLICTTAAAEPVRIETAGKARPLIRIYGDSESVPLKICLRGCSVDLPRGRYRIAVAATPNTYEYDENVDVRGPTRVAVDPGDKSGRRAAIALGWTFLGVSVPVLVTGLMLEWSDNVETGEKGHFGPICIIGSALAGVGLISLGTAITLKPSITSGDIALGVAPTRNGAAMGAALRF